MTILADTLHITWSSFKGATLIVGMAELRNNDPKPEKTESRNSGKWLQILKDEMAENPPTS